MGSLTEAVGGSGKRLIGRGEGEGVLARLGGGGASRGAFGIARRDWDWPP